MEDMIYKRKSCRDFTDEKLDNGILEDIKSYIENVESLIPEIKTNYEIVSKDLVKTPLRWSAPHYIAIFSQNKKNYLTNIGFIYQQVDLYLQSINLGSCWLGLASYKGEIPEDLEFVIFIGFGKSKNPHRTFEEFNRKTLNEISDKEDERLKPAQYAPSAVNGQPWYFKHTDDELDVYCKNSGLFKKLLASKMPYIDIGIALAHLYITNKDSFTFYLKSNPNNIKKHEYIGTIKI